jgi:hypothetical protein
MELIMRMAFLSTVAVAAVSLSVAATAQVGSGTNSSEGSIVVATTGGGTSGGGTTGGGTSGGGTTSGGTTSGGTTSGGTTSGGTAAGSGTVTTGETGAGNVQITGEQRTRAVQTLRTINIQPVQENVTVTVGQPLPTTVTRLVDCPQTLESLITGVRDCKVVLIGNRYYVVEGSSRRVLTVIEQ